MAEVTPSVIDHSNWMDPPHNRWALQHLDLLVPTAVVSRGSTEISPLPEQPQDLSLVSYQRRDQSIESLPAMLDNAFADAFLVLHHGKLVYEQYFNDQQPTTRHCLFSCSKSLAGLVVTMLADEGQLNLAAPVKDYLPELSQSAFAAATLQSLLNMTVALRSREPEQVADLNESEVYQHMVAANYLPCHAGYKGPASLALFLSGLLQDGDHDDRFSYETANTEVLSWVAETVTGKPMSELISERLWQPLGMESDGLVLAGRDSQQSWGGGFAASARDLARLGQMVLEGGEANEGQIVPAHIIKALFVGGDQQVFSRGEEGGSNGVMRGWSYINQWWATHNGHGAIAAIGMHGQWLYLDPTAQMVVVMMSSYPDPRADYLEADVPLCFQAIAEQLQESPVMRQSI